jgi:surface polysaccharide O-acyltransferase-like enzyme
MSGNTIILQSGETRHNYGLDALKVLSMMMVLMLHFLGFGGLLGAMPGEANYYVAWSLESLSIVAVNCFMMITGYLAVDSTFKVKRILLLWLQVVFYSVGITVICMFFLNVDITKIQLIKSFLPVSTSSYWYVTAYFGAACFMPVIANGLRTLAPRYLTALTAILIVLFSIVPSAINKNPFATNSGYTVIWFLVMYIIGYAVRQGNPFPKVKPGWFLLAYLLLSLGTFTPKLVYRLVEASPLNLVIGTGLSLQYTFPTVLFASMALLMFFARIEIRNRAAVRIAAFLAPLSLAAYLIHMHPVVKAEFLTGSSQFLLDDSPFVALGSCIIIVIGLFVAMALVDMARNWIFQALRLPSLSEKVVAAVAKRFIGE